LKPVCDFALFKSIPDAEPDSIERRGLETYLSINHSINLSEQMRVPEGTDERFKSLLRRVRVGELNFSDLGLLKSRQVQLLPEQREFYEQSTVVFPERALCQAFNDHRLKETGKPIRSIPSTYSKNAPVGIKSNLSLSIGTPVVLIRNISVACRIFNGLTPLILLFSKDCL